MLLLLLHACESSSTGAADSSAIEAPAEAEPGIESESEPESPTESEPEPETEPESDPGPGPEQHCAEVDAFVPQFTEDVARFAAQDDRSPGPPGSVVFVGSSSIRRWEGLALAYTDHEPRQRGVGGSQLAEIAQAADALVLRHDPRAVVVFAGTNDVDAGVPADVVIERFQCLRERVARGLGSDRPVLFIGITPTIARWDQWETADAVNQAVAALAEADPALTYVDVPSLFLATGSPPDASLFVADGLHLSDAGYALWDRALRPAVDAAAPPLAPVAPGSAPLASGTRLLFDLGPSNAEDGELTPSPDWLGQAWSNWHAAEGGEDVLPGEHLDGLVADDGAATGVGVVVTGGFYLNGRSNGGLLWPDPALLGGLAVGSATGDFGYTVPDDQTGGLMLRGLDPGQSYTVRLFAARDEAQRRVTSYTLRGADTRAATLQTSGAGAGALGGTTNDDTVVTFAGVTPDPWGHLFLDVAIAEGDYAYLSLLELIVD
jgi:lysophospholipase L1-like esterase